MWDGFTTGFVAKDGTESFGAWMVARRKALKITQERLAEMVGGVAILTIRRWEGDENQPAGAHQIVLLANALRVTVVELMERLTGLEISGTVPHGNALDAYLATPAGREATEQERAQLAAYPDRAEVFYGAMHLLLRKKVTPERAAEMAAFTANNVADHLRARE